jgi:hypothetical protein
MTRRYNANPVSNFMAWLGGARLDVLQDAPGDRARFVAMGGVILSTAFLSAVSAAFALKMAVGAPIAVAVIVGIFWGVIILNLDRLLIIGMAKQKGVWRNLALALPRVALALIIGTVISTPLVLQIFSAEINSEIQVMQAEDKAAFEEKIASDPRYAAIPSLEESIAANQAIVDKGLQTDLSSDPNYAAAAAATAAAQAAYDTAQAAYLAEIDGSGGTGVRGDGPVTASKQTALDQAAARLDAAKAAEQAAADAASTNLQAGAQSRLDAAKAQLAADQATLATAQSQRADEQAAYSSAVDNSAGLLSRLSALFRLGEANALLNVAHIMIALLFVCIELLPVIVKVLANLGGPTAYDRLVDVREDGEVSGGSIWASERARAIEVEAGVQVAVASDRAERQLEFGKRVNQAVLEQQEIVISRALEVWGRHAGARAEERMEEWERELGASDASPATTADASAAGASTQGRRMPRIPARFARGDGARDARGAALGTGGSGVAGGSVAGPSERDAAVGSAVGSAASSSSSLDSSEERDATDELAWLFAEHDDDLELDPRNDRTEPIDTPSRDETVTRPLPRTPDQEAFLRRAGLPDQF